ncbi:MAG: RNA polymerase sigma factor [Ktedonobacterales bacterium]
MWLSKSRLGNIPEDSTDEVELVTAAQSDPPAFDALYRRYLPQVYHYVRTQVPNVEDAADLTQQIFLQALDALPSYHARGLPFAAWLFRIARHVVIDSYRRHRSGTVALEALPEALHPVAGSDPLAVLLQRERGQRLYDMLNALDRQKRELLMLRFAGQLSSSEIAAVVGKSPAAVQKQLTRILAELKGHYHDA